MLKPRGFGEALRRLRKGHGFVSAYSFFRGREGRRNLGVNFRGYLNLEQGKSLPRPETLRSILGALGLGGHSEEARVLVRAYFADAGIADFVDLLRAPLDFSRDEDLEIVARQELRRRTAQLTLRQWRLCARSPDANVCHHYLANTPGGASLREIGERVNLSLDRVRKAVEALQREGLAFVAGTRARSAFEGAALLELPELATTNAIIRALERQRSALSRRARLNRRAVIIARLSPESLARVRARLERLVDFISMCEERSPASGSAIYQFLGELSDLFPGSSRAT